MLLADEFFLIVHDDATGKPRLNPGATGIGLAAALLGELLLFGRITVESGELTIVDRRPPPDALAHTVLDQLAGEAQHRQIRLWIDFLRHGAAGSVGERLARSGVVRRHEFRRLLRTTTAYLPVDINAAAWPATRLRALVDRGEAADQADLALLGLVGATNLTREVLWHGRSEAQRLVDRLLTDLTPPLRELVAHTEAAVGAAVLSHRQ
ncbi:GPP34 family phosphoprotein [Polymorphospora sp. NPDC051019]|uniref:GOLPH3/VPS74 family protein n=1 Tax=Polymorphospora sp. NPDC051019 TaxID=3155725 RepID=UPI003425018F